MATGIPELSLVLMSMASPYNMMMAMSKLYLMNASDLIIGAWVQLLNAISKTPGNGIEALYNNLVDLLSA